MDNTAATEEISDQAIEWFVRLRAEDVREIERESFLNWLRLSRTHQSAFVEILNLWRDMAVVKCLDFEELKQFPDLQELRSQLG